MAIQTRLIDYTDGDTHLEGYLALDNSLDQPRPGVLIAHAFGGRSDFECEKARLLAQQGYVGFAMDMYGEGRGGDTFEENSALMQPFLDDREKLQKRMTLALSALRQQPEVDDDNLAAMGFCFGGLCVLDLARTGADIRGAISFHGLLTPPGNTADTPIKARILALHGYDDPMVPPQSLLDFANEMTGAGADWQVHAYGNTLHSFTNPEANDPELGAKYDAAADRRSWTSLLNFLEEIF
jgi:dienelactone hydrolase